MDYCYVLEISFLRVHAYSVILKAHLQIHIPFTFFYFQFRFEGVFEVIVNVECFVGSIYFSKRCSFETFRFQSSANKFMIDDGVIDQLQRY